MTPRVGDYVRCGCTNCNHDLIFVIEAFYKNLVDCQTLDGTTASLDRQFLIPVSNAEVAAALLGGEHEGVCG